MQALPSEMRSFVELPRLQVDARGRLWVVVRHLTDLTPPGTRMVGGQARPYQARGIWNPYVLCYDDNGWSSPVRIPSSNGRNDMRTSLCLDRQGALWAAWAEDGRVPTRAEEPGNHEVYAARLNLSRTPVASPAVKPMKPSSAASADLIEASLSRPRHEMTLAGVSYRLVFGDTHRHTDISRCAMNFDGSLMDTYRYAIDAAGLDFLAISDHDQDLLKHRYSRDKQGPLQDYAWWRSQKYCDLFHLEGRFLPIYGYEHGGSFAQRGGHKNVMFLQRGNPCFEEDSPEELFFVLRDREAVVIPHQLADGSSATDWGKWNVQFERVAEIFQARGSYEFFGCPREAAVKRQGHYLRDALDSGVRVGVIASSDHGLVHNAYAGTYVRDFTRAGILEALRSRRSYGATETIVLDFRCGDRPLGSEVELDGPPQFQVNARGTEPLDSVEIVRDGKIVYSVRPEAQSSEFRYTDMDLGRGQAAYYYLRCRQTDDQWAWSSAIWVARN